MKSGDVAVEFDLARWVIARVAPEELVLFRVISDAYRRDPVRVAAGGGGRDEMLGFGVEAAAVLVTPVVLTAVTEVVRYLTAEAVGAVGVRTWLRRRLRSTSDSADPPAAVAPIDGPEPGPEPAGQVGSPALDAGQLVRVRGIVLEKCQQAGVAQARAQLIADGVVGALSNGG